LPVLAREGVRALAAFALYLGLRPVWTWVGAHEIYEATVLKLGTMVVLATQHLPVVSTLEKLSIVHLDNLIVLILAYVVVSTRVPWVARLRRYGIALGAVLGLNVAGVVLETRIDAAEYLLNTEGLMLLLPWEFRIIDGFKYLLVDFGLNIGPFVLMLLGAAWNSGLSVSWERGRPATGRPATGRPAPRERRRPSWWSSRQGLKAVVILVLLLAPGLLAWRWLRESDARHVATHARLGHLFLRNRQPDTAADQYRIAMERGSTEGEVFLNLSSILANDGRIGEALRVQRRGLEVVQDTAMRARLQKSRDGLESRR
jgi:hypothetical protein